MTKIRLAPWQLSLAGAVVIVVTNNSGLFAAISENLELRTVNGIGFVLTIVLLMVFVLNSIFLVAGIGRLQKLIIAIFFVATAILGYFSNEIGVAFDEDMFLNIAETIRDRNSAEAIELASLPLIVHVVIHGLVPSLLLGFIEVVPRRFVPELCTRALLIAVGMASLAVVTFPNYKFAAYFAREHRDLRFKAMPVLPLISLVKLARDSLRDNPAFHVVDSDAIRSGPTGRRSIGIMVVGETARADHFSLNGYGRQTNPALAQTEGVTFARADSCGTSTLFSVPCMFSMRGRDDYSPREAALESNVLDILTAAGVRTVWIDNNSSCKHVCDRIESVNLRQNLNESSRYFSDTGYYDEALLEEIDGYLHGDAPDTLIVLHMLGSHGPAYSRRYPARFRIFSPFCDNASPQECSDEALANAYDNTIVYTDHVLKRLIEKLQAHNDDFDAFLFYASDHGESLGENGIYLHGLPYAIAPKAQTEVPFIVWLSTEFRSHHGIDATAMGAPRAGRLSHDNISHTLLGFYKVDASTYLPQLDIFARSRHPLELDAG